MPPSPPTPQEVIIICEKQGFCSYLSTNPAEAQEVANAVGEEFSDLAVAISPSANAITAEVWELAQTPDAPVSPEPLRTGLVALALGGIFGVGLAFMLEHWFNIQRSAKKSKQVPRSPASDTVPALGHTGGRREE